MRHVLIQRLAFDLSVTLERCDACTRYVRELAEANGAHFVAGSIQHARGECPPQAMLHAAARASSTAEPTRREVNTMTDDPKNQDPEPAGTTETAPAPETTSEPQGEPDQKDGD